MPLPHRVEPSPNEIEGSPLPSSFVLRQAMGMEDRERLAAYVRAERKRLGYTTRKKWDQAIILNIKSLGRLERGEYVGPEVFAEVENFFGWAPGSCVAIMEGGKPTRTDRAVDPGAPLVTGLTPKELRWVSDIVEEVFDAHTAEKFYTSARRLRRQWETRKESNGDDTIDAV